MRALEIFSFDTDRWEPSRILSQAVEPAINQISLIYISSYHINFANTINELYTWDDSHINAPLWFSELNLETSLPHVYVDWDVKHLYVAGELTRRNRDFHNKGGNATGNAPGTALVVAFKEERCDRDHNEEVRNDGDGRW